MTVKFTDPCNQGELRFYRLPDKTVIPKDAKKLASKDGKVIVGHSETGHHHVMTAERTEVYQLPNNLLECLIVVRDPDELTHLRDFDQHESIRFEPGKYRMRRLREYIPDGFRAQQD